MTSLTPSRPAPAAPSQRHDQSPNVTLSPRGGSEGAGGAVRRQAGSGWGVLVTEHGAVEWAARLPPSNFSPMLPGDHVPPARQPNSCSPHFDNDEKQMPSSVPTYCCWHCHSPLGCADTLLPLSLWSRVGSVGLSPTWDPITHQPLSAPGQRNQ